MFQWSSCQCGGNEDQCDGNADDYTREIMTKTQIIVMINITLHDHDIFVCTSKRYMLLFLKVGLYIFFDKDNNADDHVSTISTFLF